MKFSNGLPSSIQRVGLRKGSFSIPKRKRLQTLQFMTKHPQHIIKKRANSWEVLGIPPLMRQKGGNNYNAYLKSVKKVLSQVPDHSLNTSTLLELQADPRVKRLYDTHFKNNPDHISYPSVRNVIASNILNYDSTTDQVRDSVSDVRKKRKAPLTSVPFNLLQDHEFDRWILQILDSFLRHTNIPVTFLKSNYFTSRSQLLQLYDEDRLRFRSRVEAAADALKTQTMNDYTTLVNETNRIYMSRYPFAAIAGAMGINKHVDGFLRSERKIQELTTLVIAIPGSQLKFQDLNDMTSTYGRTTEAKLIHPEHFMIRAQKVMVDDASFIQQVLKDKSRITRIIKDILSGRSM